MENRLIPALFENVTYYKNGSHPMHVYSRGTHAEKYAIYFRLALNPSSQTAEQQYEITFQEHQCAIRVARTHHPRKHQEFVLCTREIL